MRLVVDTNVLISALLNRASPARRLVDAWEEGRFSLLTCDEQLDEFARTTRYPRIRQRITPAEAGTLKNQLRGLAIVVEAIPSVAVSADPADNWMLGLAEAGAADYLVSGDKHHILGIRQHKRTKVVALAEMLRVLQISSSIDSP